MLKLVLVLCVTVALIMPMHETQAFKVVTIQKSAAFSAPASSAPASSAPAAPAFDPSALLQGVQSAIAGKLQQVQALVGSIVQQKTALKQNALNSIQSTLGGVKSQVQGLAGNVRPPFVIRKNIYIGRAPEATTTTSHVDATTTVG